MVDQGNVTGLEDQGGAREMDPSEAREGKKPSWRLRGEKPGGFRGMTNHCETKARSGIMTSEGQGETRGLNVAVWVDLGCHETVAAPVELQG